MDTRSIQLQLTEIEVRSVAQTILYEAKRCVVCWLAGT